ncbi:MAG TPA: ThiF family adenylyltransferase [Actinokineospora sp.]|nr:ThiF family adenylyltransferase [Actinokineospora sp.]
MLRPRVKPTHRPRRLAGGRIRVGPVSLPDPGSRLWALLDLLDGTRTTAQIVDAVAPRFLTPHAALSALDRIIATGCVEDAAAPVPAELSDRDLERYSRSQAYFSSVDVKPRDSNWHAQVRLRTAKVVVVGVGGIGGSAALALATSGVGRLHLIEPGAVELSDLNRQILYMEYDLGLPKVDVAVDRLQEYNSDISITGWRSTVTGPGMLADLVEGYDLLIMTASRPLVRSWAGQACRKAGIPWVYGRYSGPLVTTGVYSSSDGPCYDCEENVAGGDLVAPQSANAVSAGMAGLRVAHVAMGILTGVPAVAVNRTYVMNLVDPGNVAVLTADERRDDCPTCAG